MPHSDLVQSLLRGMDILELVARSESGVSLREVSEFLGLKQPTAHNLVRTLIARNFLEKSPRPVRYRLGRSAIRLSQEHMTHSLIGQAIDTLKDLGQQVYGVAGPALRGEDEIKLTLAKPVGGEIAQLLRLRLPGPLIVTRDTFPHKPYSSAVGILFQAMWSRPDRQAYQKVHPFVELGQHLWKSEEELVKFLSRVRRLGYCQPPFYSDSEIRLGVPVTDGGGRIVAAIGCIVRGKLQRRKIRQLVRLMIAAGQHLSETCGGLDTDAAGGPATELSASVLSETK